MAYNKEIIDKHSQLDQFSCIPSCVEMILKLLGKVQIDYYDLQKSWRNKQDGCFGNFDQQTIFDVTFHNEFTLQRGINFPILKLSQRIDEELQAGRFVGISLPSPFSMGFHMFIIHEKINDNYASFSKEYSKTIENSNVLEMIKKINGTDILTYSINSSIN